MILTVTLNPALDRTIYVDQVKVQDTSRILKVETDAGGKGINVSRVLKELGSKTVAMGFIGGSTGRFIEHVLNHEGVRTDFVRVSQETRINLDIQECSGAPPTALNEPGPMITASELDELRDKMHGVLDGAKFAVFGGSLPPGVPTGVYSELIELARGHKVRAVLDTDGEPLRLGLEASPFMVKPNAAEAGRLLGRQVCTVEDALAAGRALIDRGVELAVISMGAQGAVAVSPEGGWIALPPRIFAISTIGSGDSMVAGIIHVLDSGGAIEDALRWGSAAGAATAMTSGTEISTRAGITGLLERVTVSRLQ